MKHVATHLCIASSIVLGCLVTLTPTAAQIVPDNTLPVNSSVTPGCTICVIDGGTVRGTNLFHSFQSFSVPTGGEAFFNNALQIQNILTRITGNSVSNLDGLIRDNGTANLFLLNPNGISFGARARLNLGGSFVASTASSLVFADGTVFSTKPDTSTPLLLTISVPLGLQYGRNPGSIQVQGATLEVGVGQTLALVGGNVQINGGRLYTSVEPPGGRVELGGLAGEGTIGLVANGPYLGLSFPVGVARGDVSLSNGSVVGVVAHGGGSIGINAFNLTMTQGSQLRAGIAPDSGAVGAVAGNIEINATGAINLTESGIFNDVDPRAQGRGGDVNITTSQLRLSGGAQVGAGTFGQGDGGNLTVNASKAVQLIGTSTDGTLVSGFYASAQPSAGGKAGNLTINTDTLLVRDGAQVSTSTFGQEKGGNLTVNAHQQVQLIGRSADGQYSSGLGASAQPGASGKAGDLTINTDTLLVRDGAQVSASTFGQGKGGDLTINTGILLVRDGAQVGTGTFGQGDGGNLIVNASKAVQLIGTSADSKLVSGLFASAERGASGKAGDLTINTGTLLVRDGAQVSTSTFGQGNGGNLTVNAHQQVQLIGRSADGHYPSGLGASAQPGASGKAGDLTINTDTLLVRDGAQVSASTFGQGKGGDLTINTGILLVRDGAQVGTGTFGQGDGGNLIVNASKAVQLIGTSADSKLVSGLFASAERGASGKAGDLTINTGTLLVRDGAQVGTSTFGQGNGGNLTVNASKEVQLIGTSTDGQRVSGLLANAERSASGKAGDLTINTDSLLMRDGAQVSTSTFGQGNGGNLTVNAHQQVQLIGRSADGHYPSGLGASAQPGASGKAGDLTINTDTLLVRDGAQVSTSTFGQGKGGDLTVNAHQQVQLIGTSADGQYPSALFASAERGASSKAGDLTINTGSLLVQGGAEVSATTFGQGKGGNLTVNASKEVQLIGTSADGHDLSGLFASAQPGASGKAGDITINTDSLLVRDGAQALVSTFAQGDGGKLTVNASQGVQLIGTSADGRAASGLFASSERGASGKAGDLTINTGTLLVRDGAQVGAGTFGRGDGGNLTVNASKEVQLIGTTANGQYPSGLFASSEGGASGKAGDLTINTDSLLVRDGAAVSVGSFQGQAGNMTILANSVFLNQGTLFAETRQSDAQGGANITLSGLEFLRMDDESLISASALGNANGGNVTIDSTLIVATPPTDSEGSDIIANAELGNGGRVNITTQGMFGIEFRPQRTPKNDITVSSTYGFSGEYTLNTPGVDPSRGLGNLPTGILDASNQIVQNCQGVRGEGGEENKFIITGRGGIPPSPNEPLRNEEAIAPSWVTLDSEVNPNTSPTPTTPNSSTPKPLTEANGWIIDEKGQVELIAAAPTVTPHVPWQPPVNCRQVSRTDSQ